MKYSGTKLFVYGTLKRGGVRAVLLSGQAFVAEVATAPRYRMFSTGDYPALVEAGPLGLEGLSIRGELWRVDASCLARLDEEEGVSEGLYTRGPIALQDENASAQAYFYLPSIQGMADCGDYW